MTEETKNNQSVKRITSITFNTKADLVNALAAFGINVRRTVRDTAYYDGGTRVYGETAHALQRHGIPVELRYDWYRNTRNAATLEIREYFGLSQDVYLDIQAYYIEVKTYNLNEEMHREEVKKLYGPIKALGYKVAHDCEREVTSGTC